MKTRILRVVAAIVMIGVVGGLSACGKKEPEAVKGYYDGPMESKGASGKSAQAGAPR